MRELDERVALALSGIGDDLIAEAACVPEPEQSPAVRRRRVSEVVTRWIGIAAATAMLCAGGAVMWNYLFGTAPEEGGVSAPGSAIYEAPDYDPERVVVFNESGFLLSYDDWNTADTATLDALYQEFGLRLDIGEVADGMTPAKTLWPERNAGGYCPVVFERPDAYITISIIEESRWVEAVKKSYELFAIRDSTEINRNDGATNDEAVDEWINEYAGGTETEIYEINVIEDGGISVINGKDAYITKIIAYNGTCEYVVFNVEGNGVYIDIRAEGITDGELIAVLDYFTRQ